MHTNICGVYVCLHSYACVYSDESVSFCMVEKINFAEHFATSLVSCIVLMFIYFFCSGVCNFILILCLNFNKDKQKRLFI